ncbi:ABC transporter ATP-binding protein [Ochrobactrum sp. Kaboul]|nr:ABC transporter ATP-binding protein [Ochrobactrum sp. Kaboul]
MRWLSIGWATACAIFSIRADDAFLERIDMTLLDVKGLTVAFANRDRYDTAVENIDFHIEPGEIVALVGESGSGKSVTASAIMGLLPQRSTRLGGSIRFEGQELLDLSERALNSVRGAGVSMIFQNPLTSLDPSFRIGQQLEENLRYRKQLSASAAREEALGWLHKVGIRNAERVLRSFPHELSGGMRQRVMITLAIMNNPKLLIADEPTTALDATIQKQILDLLLDINREFGTAILMITHDFGVVSYLSQRVAVMKSGKIVEQGPTAQLLTEPQNDYTRRLINAVPVVGDRIANPSASRRIGVPAAAGADQGAAHVRSDEVVLSLEGIHKEFASHAGFFSGKAAPIPAVRDANLDVRRGEIFGLIGESGSGKSTLARLAAKLIPVTSGSIRFLGEDIGTLDAEANRRFRSRFQFVFQDSTASLNPRKTVGEQLIAAPLRLKLVQSRKQALEQAADTLERVGLRAQHLNRYPHEFSGGQRQRIGIARALAVNPEFVILDEPTSALDVSIQAQILNLLLDLRESLNLTYLVIGHNLPVIEFLCDRVAVMEQGRILETFNAVDLFASGKHPSTRKLIESVLPIRRVQQPADQSAHLNAIQELA